MRPGGVNRKKGELSRMVSADESEVRTGPSSGASSGRQYPQYAALEM